MDDKFSFGSEKIEEGLRPQNNDKAGDTAHLPPTQTLPVTLGRDGTKRRKYPALGGSAT